MINKIVRLALTLALALAAGSWAQAQEDEAPAPRKPLPKAQQEAKAKAQEKKQRARAKAEAEAKAKAVDINHATKAQLMTLPGIDLACAEAIVAKRPYRSKADLVEKKAIPAGTFHIIRKLVVAK